MNKVIAFVPIKLNSERLPNKNIIKLFKGKSLIDLTLSKLEKIYQMGILDEYYVYCSDSNILDSISQYKGCRLLIREKSLDNASTTSNDIVTGFTQLVSADTYVLCHVTSPFIKLESYINCINNVVKKGYDSSFISHKIYGIHWFNEKPLNFEIDNIGRTQDLSPVMKELSSPYVFTSSLGRKNGRRSSINSMICSSKKYEEIDIDNQDDMDYAIYLYDRINDNE